MRELAVKLRDRSVGAELEFSLNHGFDAIIHVLNEGNFRAAKTTAIGNVKDSVARVRVLTMAAADLHIVPVGDGLEPRPVLHQVRKMDVHGSTKGGTKIGRARSDVAEMVVVSKACNLFDGGCSTRQAAKYLTYISTLLH